MSEAVSAAASESEKANALDSAMIASPSSSSIERSTTHVSPVNSSSSVTNPTAVDVVAFCAAAQRVAADALRL